MLARATLAASSDSGVAFVVGTVPHAASSAKRVEKTVSRDPSCEEPAAGHHDLKRPRAVVKSSSFWRSNPDGQLLSR